MLDSLDKFLAWNPQTTDTASPHLKAVKLFQDVLRVHRTDSVSAARVDADIARLLFWINSEVGEGARDRFIESIRDVAENEPGQLSAWVRVHWATALN